MGGAISAAQLETWKTLLREGRVTEADNQIETARLAMEEAERVAKLAQPAGTPMSDAELAMAFQSELCAQLGNPPRLTALLVEIIGRTRKQ